MYMLMGAPGSGKSTLAHKICPIVFEADSFFYDRFGVYRFDRSKLQEAHDKCFESCKKAMERGVEFAVANTFTRQWERQRYLDLAKEMGYTVVPIHCLGQFQNVHGVPHEVVGNMKKRFEPFQP